MEHLLFAHVSLVCKAPLLPLTASHLGPPPPWPPQAELILLPAHDYTTWTSNARGCLHVPTLNWGLLRRFRGIKNPSANPGDSGGADPTPGSGRSLGGGSDYPLQYSCLGNRMDRGPGRLWSLESQKESDTTEHAHTPLQLLNRVPGSHLWRACSKPYSTHPGPASEETA